MREKKKVLENEFNGVEEEYPKKFRKIVKNAFQNRNKTKHRKK